MYSTIVNGKLCDKCDQDVNLKEEGVLAGPECDGSMTWRKILE
jgi:hypothetical protein